MTKDYWGICTDCGARWALPEEWVLEAEQRSPGWVERLTHRHRGSDEGTFADAAGPIDELCCPECGSAKQEIEVG